MLEFRLSKERSGLLRDQLLVKMKILENQEAIERSDTLSGRIRYFDASQALLVDRGACPGVGGRFFC